MNKNTVITISIFLVFIFLGLLAALYLTSSNGTADTGKGSTNTNTGTGTPPSTGTGTNTGTGTGTGTPPSTGTGTNTGTSGGTDPYSFAYRLADEFRTYFLGNPGTRCGIIREVSHLNDSALKQFSAYYSYEYGLSPLDEMNLAYVWCPFGWDGINLHSRFENL